MKKYRGFSLVEIMIAAVMLLIVALAALSYQYHSVKQKRIAWADMAAMRTAQMVMEDWKSTGGQPLSGSNAYNPKVFDSKFVEQVGDVWRFEIENVPMYLKLSIKNNVLSNNATGSVLHQLTVTVQWNADFGSDVPNNNSPSIVLESYI